MIRSVLRAAVIAVGAMTAVFAGPASAATKTDFAAPNLAWNILTPGQHGGIIADTWSVDQAYMYDALTPLRGNVTMADVQSGNYYKPEVFEKAPATGTPRIGLAGHAGITWWLDSHKVPHIYGKTRNDVSFALGYFTAQDRNVLISAGRGPGYVSSLSVPGVNGFGLITSATKFTPSAQTKQWMTDQVNTFKNANSGNMQVYTDYVNWVAGLNAWYSAYDPTNAGWTVEDAFAAFSFIGSIFGNGGGGEVGNSNFLAKLQAQYGESKGLQIYRDFRHSNDLDAPVSWKDTTFPYNVQPTNTNNAGVPGSKVIDVGSETASVSRAAVEAEKGINKRYMSNALLVPSSRSASGHPLAVMGPQLGYYYPEIVMEADVHGGGYDFRGAIAPVAPYGLLGRAQDYSWSLTSASSDNTDQFLEKLCNTDGSPASRSSDHYIHNGSCIAMTTWDAGLLGNSTRYGAAHELTFKETVHGPVSGTVTVDGAPYAVSNARANRGREPWSARALADLSTGKVKSSKDFFKIANEFDTTFNWHYVDYKNICFFSSGRLPIRATGIDSSLPTLGTGPYDWKGFIDQNTHPHGCNPKKVGTDNASDLILNWNNHPAKGWGAADDEWGYASTHRMGLFQRLFRTAHSGGKTLHLNDVVSVMNQAATEDTSAVNGWPNVKRVLLSGTGKTFAAAAPDADTAAFASSIDDWITNHDASRLDGNLDGSFDYPGVAQWGVAWPQITNAVLDGRLTESLRNDTWGRAGRGDKTNNGMGTGFVNKDLGTLLGDRFLSPYSQTYCGGTGGLAACRTALWTALQTAKGISTSENPVDQREHFGPLYPNDPITKTEVTMRWVNRPTFQQAISYDSHRK